MTTHAQRRRYRRVVWWLERTIEFLSFGALICVFFLIWIAFGG